MFIIGNIEWFSEMFNKITIIFFSILCITACSKRCKDAEDNARTKPKNVALMYIWRSTDNLIVKKSSTMNSDSGFLSFKPNGDFMTGTTIKDLNAVPYVWYVNNDMIVKTSCTDNFPKDIDFGKYYIRNDTLFFSNRTYVHYWKY